MFRSADHNLILHTLDAVDMAVLLVDIQGDGAPRVFAANRRAARDFDLNERVGVELQTALGAERAARHLPFYRRCAKEETVVVFEDWLDPAQSRWGRFTLAPVNDHERRPARLLVTAVETADERTSGSTAPPAGDLTRQAQKMEAIGRLAGGIAHDFNNMLTVIQGYAELLLQGAGEDPESRAAGQILEATKRARALTQQLMTFGRKRPRETRTLDPNQSIGDVRYLLEHLIREDVRVEFDLDPEAGWVRADPYQIEQIVMNLALNAQDAMPDGGTLRIATRSRAVEGNGGRTLGVEPGRFLSLQVTDTGSGIAPDHLERIFEPFFTTKGEEGTGLGLSTVYGIAMQLDGTVLVDSELGKGSAFEVLLPQAKEEPAVPALSPERSAAGPLSTAGTMTVLLVEDDAQVRELMARTLTDWGFAVLEAADGAEAVALARALDSALDLVISDVVLPLLGGRQLRQELEELHPEVYFLFTSGYPEPGAVGGEELPPLLVKPFGVADFRRAVEDVIAQRAARS